MPERYGVNGGSFRPRTTFASITDGLSNTFLVGEKALNKTDLKNSILWRWQTCISAIVRPGGTNQSGSLNNTASIRYVMNTAESSLSTYIYALGEQPCPAWSERRYRCPTSLVAGTQGSRSLGCAMVPSSKFASTPIGWSCISWPIAETEPR